MPQPRTRPLSQEDPRGILGLCLVAALVAVQILDAVDPHPTGVARIIGIVLSAAATLGWIWVAGSVVAWLRRTGARGTGQALQPLVGVLALVVVAGLIAAGIAAVT